MRFRVLIVDDETEKIGIVKEAILDSGEVAEEEIHFCTEMREALKCLEKERYDLVFLDIMLPAKMGDKKIPNGGSTILQSIKRMDRIKKPLCIIGITAHDELLDHYEKVFRETLFSLIKYERDSIEWRSQITEKVKWLVKARRELLIEERNTRQYSTDIAIITAVPVEQQAVLELPLDWQEYSVPYDSVTYHITEKKVGNKKIRLVLARQRVMGMSAAATTTTKVINIFNPHYVVMVGIAGGRKDEVCIGDVIVAGNSYDYGSGKWKSNEETQKIEFEADIDMITVSSEILDIFSKDFSSILNELREQWRRTTHQDVNIFSKVHIGLLASGAAVIQVPEILNNYIKPHARKFKGVDMETYGVYYACREAFKPRPEFVSIKSVSDYADPEKGDEFQAYCAFLSANILYKLLVEGKFSQ